MRDLYIIAHDMRSSHNVGSLFRTAEGLGVKKLYLTGYTPHPSYMGDHRLPHIAQKLSAQIEKTALGSTKSLDWEYHEDIKKVLNILLNEKISIAALEQTPQAINLVSYDAPERLALVLGTEVTGLPPDILKNIQTHLVIPMFGRKESFNVVQAAAMALYEFRFH